jgi:hypothetical protein
MKLSSLRKRTKKRKKISQTFRNMWDNIRLANIGITGWPNGEEWEKTQNNYLKKNSQKFPKFVFFYFYLFICLLFICAYNAWVISPLFPNLMETLIYKSKMLNNPWTGKSPRGPQLHKYNQTVKRQRGNLKKKQERSNVSCISLSKIKGWKTTRVDENIEEN